MKPMRWAGSGMLIGLMALALPLVASAGVPTEWIRTIDGPNGGYDQAQYVVTDGAASVYVTGTSSRFGGPSYDITTVKFDSDGNKLWEYRYGTDDLRTYAPTAMCLDAAGNTYVAGYGGGTISELDGHDIVTLKIDPQGNLLWAETYAGADGLRDRASDVCVDDNGNVSVTGVVHVADGSSDFVTLKYDAAGALLWERSYSGPNAGIDIPLSVKSDSQENIVVVGQSRDPGGLSDIVTIKYDAAGALVWQHQYDGAGQDDDIPDATTIDTDGNVYICGHVNTITPNTDIVTLKYAANGTLLWTAVYGSARNASEVARVIRVDDAGNVLVGGFGSLAMGLEGEIISLKYDAAGALMREVSVPKPLGDDQTILQMVFDADENLYATGFVETGSGDFDAATVKLAADGTLQWTKQYDAVASLGDEAHALALDSDGNVYVAGMTYNPEFNSDLLTIKYGTSFCSCPYQANLNEDNAIDAIDLNLVIDDLFFGGLVIADPGCPTDRADFNADGVPDAVDLNELLDYMFFGGDGPTDPCGP